MKFFRRIRNFLAPSVPGVLALPDKWHFNGEGPPKSCPKKRFEQWDRKRLHKKLRAAGWYRKTLTPHGPRSWQHDADPLPRSTRNAAKIAGLIL